MKNNKKIIIAILAVAMIIAAVFGATYAYWTWVTNTEQRTTVSFQTTAPDMYANLTGNGAGTTSLKPSACTNGIKKTVTIKYKNDSIQPATITATLSVTAFTFRNDYRPTAGNSGDLKNIKYVLTTTEDNCTSGASGIQKSGDFSGLTIPATGTTASGLPTALFSQTISVPANTKTEQTATYYLYIWLDSSYSHENEGNVNNDPLQDISFTTTWSGTIAQNG